MDEKLLTQKAKEIIESIIYTSLATVNNDDQPWNTPVFFAYDKQYNFYWRSTKDSVHSKNIKMNNKIFLSVYNSKSPWGTGEGVYIQALATELNDKDEITKALALLDARSPKKVGNAETFMDEFPRRIYKATPEKIWMNGDGEINGIFVDKRIEIILH